LAARVYREFRELKDPKGCKGLRGQMVLEDLLGYKVSRG
jgi:hypothetical protein